MISSRKFLRIFVTSVIFVSTAWYILQPTLKVSSNQEPILDTKPLFQISFLETKSSFENVFLTPRQACAIESAARIHKNASINLFFVNHKRHKNLKETTIIEALKEYKNIKISALNIDELSRGSPLEDFIKSKILLNSKYMVEHTSDVFRYLVLWKYGGVYMDMDMILQRSFYEFPTNFACLQQDNIINGAVLRFEGELGRELVEVMMKDMSLHFQPNIFIANGPSIVTNLFKQRCKMDSTLEIMKIRNCNGLQVLDTKYCYAVGYLEYRKFYDPKYADEVMTRTNESLVTHFWNFMTKNKPIRLSKNLPSAYILKARQFCPKVLKATKKYF
jgi:lactosylceramide 4-alpha-galactosyltransferase